jgi:L-alanine-DL-glutamate epimerase-like enolase superfamily enzyme
MTTLKYLRRRQVEELSMKIKDIRTIALSCKCEPPYASASGVQAARGALLVEVETDDGTIGIGEAGPAGGATATCIERDLKPLLLDEDPLMIEALWQKMYIRTRIYGRGGVVMNAMSGIDIALWDIAGKVAKMPVYKLLGACRDRVRPGLQGHEDEDRPQPVDRHTSAPTLGQCRFLRDRSVGGFGAHRRGAQGAGAAR